MDERENVFLVKRSKLCAEEEEKEKSQLLYLIEKPGLWK